jgi:hypothetical protein
MQTDEQKDILMRIQRAHVFSKDWHDNITRWRKLYDFDHYANKAKPGEGQYKDPTYTNVVDLTVGIFQGNRMSWKAVGWDVAPDAVERASAGERFLAAALDINCDRNQYNIIYEAYLNFARDGAAVLYSVWDGEVEDMYQESGPEGKLLLTELPLTLEVIDPLNVDLLPGGANRWAAVVRVEDMSLYDVKVRWPDAVFEGQSYKGLSIDQQMGMKGALKDYWQYAYTKDVPVPEAEPDQVVPPSPNKKKLVVQRALLWNDEFIRPLKVMEGYSAIPYTVSFFKPTTRNDSKGWYGILQPLETTVPEIEKSVNRRSHMIDVFASMPLIVQTQQGRQITIDPGLTNFQQIGQDEDIRYPAWQGSPPDVDRQLDFFRGKVQQSGYSDVMYGSGANAVSGYVVSQLGDQNRIRLEQPISHLESLWSWHAKKMLDLTYYFAKDVLLQIYGQFKGQHFADMIDGGQLHGYHVTCSIKPEFPNEVVRRHAMATQVKGILPETTIMENYLGIEQPDIERKKKLFELAQNNPVVMQYALMANMQEMAEAGDPIAALALQSLQQQGQQGQPGRPPEPNAPEQPMGLQSPTGQPTPQSQGRAPMKGEGQPQAPNMSGGVA